VRVSFLEIYQERVADLLAATAAPAELNVRYDRRAGFYTEAHEVACANATEAIALLQAGNRRRHVAPTAANKRSNRAHTVFRLMVQAAASGGASGGRTAGCLSFVDLAGSERVAKTAASGQRLKEAGKINRSLLALAQVVKSLDTGNDDESGDDEPWEGGFRSPERAPGPRGGPSCRRKHQPFRDSKLTQLLQPALAGKGRAAVICCVSFAGPNFAETAATVEFARHIQRLHFEPEVSYTMQPPPAPAPAPAPAPPKPPPPAPAPRWATEAELSVLAARLSEVEERSLRKPEKKQRPPRRRAPQVQAPALPAASPLPLRTWMDRIVARADRAAAAPPWGHQPHASEEHQPGASEMEVCINTLLPSRPRPPGWQRYRLRLRPSPPHKTSQLRAQTATRSRTTRCRSSSPKRCSFGCAGCRSRGS
jgi:hypothetical protein